MSEFQITIKKVNAGNKRVNHFINRKFHKKALTLQQLDCFFLLFFIYLSRNHISKGNSTLQVKFNNQFLKNRTIIVSNSFTRASVSILRALESGLKQEYKSRVKDLSRADRLEIERIYIYDLNKVQEIIWESGFALNSDMEVVRNSIINKMNKKDLQISAASKRTYLFYLKKYSIEEVAKAVLSFQN